MHELWIASGLVEKLPEFSRQNPARTIIEVRLEIGELSHTDSNTLSFCCESITKGTRVQNSSLIIQETPALVKCPYRSYRGRPNYSDDVLVAAPVITMRCLECGETVAADRGQERTIKSIRFSEANAAQTL